MSFSNWFSASMTSRDPQRCQPEMSSRSSSLTTVEDAEPQSNAREPHDVPSDCSETNLDSQFRCECVSMNPYLSSENDTTAHSSRNRCEHGPRPSSRTRVESQQAHVHEGVPHTSIRTHLRRFHRHKREDGTSHVHETCVQPHQLSRLEDNPSNNPPAQISLRNHPLASRAVVWSRSSETNIDCDSSHRHRATSCLGFRDISDAARVSGSTPSTTVAAPATADKDNEQLVLSSKGDEDPCVDLTVASLKLIDCRPNYSSSSLSTSSESSAIMDLRNLDHEWSFAIGAQSVIQSSCTSSSSLDDLELNIPKIGTRKTLYLQKGQNGKYEHPINQLSHEGSWNGTELEHHPSRAAENSVRQEKMEPTASCSIYPCLHTETDTTERNPPEEKCLGKTSSKSQLGMMKFVKTESGNLSMGSDDFVAKTELGFSGETDTTERNPPEEKFLGKTSSESQLGMMKFVKTESGNLSMGSDDFVAKTELGFSGETDTTERNPPEEKFLGKTSSKSQLGMMKFVKTESGNLSMGSDDFVAKTELGFSGETDTTERNPPEEKFLGKTSSKSQLGMMKFVKTESGNLSMGSDDFVAKTELGFSGDRLKKEGEETECGEQSREEGKLTVGQTSVKAAPLQIADSHIAVSYSTYPMIHGTKDRASLKPLRGKLSRHKLLKSELVKVNFPEETDSGNASMCSEDFLSKTRLNLLKDLDVRSLNAQERGVRQSNETVTNAREGTLSSNLSVVSEIIQVSRRTVDLSLDDEHVSRRLEEIVTHQQTASISLDDRREIAINGQSNPSSNIEGSFGMTEKQAAQTLDNHQISNMPSDLSAERLPGSALNPATSDSHVERKSSGSPDVLPSQLPGVSQISPDIITHEPVLQEEIRISSVDKPAAVKSENIFPRQMGQLYDAVTCYHVSTPCLYASSGPSMHLTEETDLQADFSKGNSDVVDAFKGDENCIFSKRHKQVDRQESLADLRRELIQKRHVLARRQQEETKEQVTIRGGGNGGTYHQQKNDTARHAATPRREHGTLSDDPQNDLDGIRVANRGKQIEAPSNPSQDQMEGHLTNQGQNEAPSDQRQENADRNVTNRQALRNRRREELERKTIDQNRYPVKVSALREAPSNEEKGIGTERQVTSGEQLGELSEGQEDVQGSETCQEKRHEKPLYQRQEEVQGSETCQEKRREKPLYQRQEEVQGSETCQEKRHEKPLYQRQEEVQGSETCQEKRHEKPLYQRQEEVQGSETCQEKRHEKPLYQRQEEVQGSETCQEKRHEKPLYQRQDEITRLVNKQALRSLRFSFTEWRKKKSSEFPKMHSFPNVEKSVTPKGIESRYLEPIVARLAKHAIAWKLPRASGGIEQLNCDDISSPVGPLGNSVDVSIDRSRIGDRDRIICHLAEELALSAIHLGEEEINFEKLHTIPNQRYIYKVPQSDSAWIAMSPISLREISDLTSFECLNATANENDLPQRALKIDNARRKKFEPLYEYGRNCSGLKTGDHHETAKDELSGSRRQIESGNIGRTKAKFEFDDAVNKMANSDTKNGVESTNTANDMNRFVIEKQLGHLDAQNEMKNGTLNIDINDTELDIEIYDSKTVGTDEERSTGNTFEKADATSERYDVQLNMEIHMSGNVESDIAQKIESDTEVNSETWNENVDLDIEQTTHVHLKNIERENTEIKLGMKSIGMQVKSEFIHLEIVSFSDIEMENIGKQPDKILSPDLNSASSDNHNYLMCSAHDVYPVQSNRFLPIPESARRNGSLSGQSYSGLTEWSNCIACGRVIARAKFTEEETIYSEMEMNSSELEDKNINESDRGNDEYMNRQSEKNSRTVTQRGDKHINKEIDDFSCHRNDSISQYNADEWNDSYLGIFNFHGRQSNELVDSGSLIASMERDLLRAQVSRAPANYLADNMESGMGKAKSGMGKAKSSFEEHTRDEYTGRGRDNISSSKLRSFSMQKNRRRVAKHYTDLVYDSRKPHYADREQFAPNYTDGRWNGSSSKGFNYQGQPSELTDSEKLIATVERDILRSEESKDVSSSSTEMDIIEGNREEYLENIYGECERQTDNEYHDDLQKGMHYIDPARVKKTFYLYKRLFTDCRL